MKKIITALAVILAAAAGANAQNMYDAIAYSENNYYGTARSMALGNAMTAVGGDLGSIGINPAGSAVAGYGQITITPGLTISSVSSAFSPEGESAYGLSGTTGSTRANLPNLGISFSFNTGRRSGVKSYSFAVVSNQTNSFNYSTSAYGLNSRTSRIAEFANAAAGMDESLLANYNSFSNSNISWDILSAYQGGMFGSYGQGSQYAGVTEFIDPSGNYHYVPGTLSQSSSTSKTGSKNDIIFNFGLNVSDKVFLGLNIGIPSIDYKYYESFTEAAVNPEQFPITFQIDDQLVDTYFNRGGTSYQYAANVDGIYAKFGAIFLPAEGFRIGAAIQTPTSYTISESWINSASTSFSDAAFDDNQSSPRGEYSYCLRSPYIADFGIAYTFGTRGFVSFDYELTDYSVMKFSELEKNYVSEDPFFDLNQTNKHFAGIANMFRIGAEYRLSPEFSLRAGYTLATSPERHWTNNYGEEVTAGDYLSEFYSSYNTGLKTLVSSKYYDDKTRSISCGLGYSSNGSFFADIAARCTMYPDTTFSPYYDYDSYNASGNLQSIQAPRILNHRKLWNVALTLGWRF